MYGEITDNKIIMVKFMKYSKLIFSVPVFVFLFGCATPQPEVREVVRTEVQVREVQVPSPPDTLMPLSGWILQRLGESTSISDEIGRYQFILFGRIVLEREYTESNDGLLEGGTARFENAHVRENITINDQTEGQAMSIGRTASGQTVLAISFEEDSNLRLLFSASTANLNDYFYLLYTSNGLSSISDERGVLVYGGNTYRLKYTGDRSPYLLIRLSQRDTDTLNSRTAPGRRVGD